MIFVFRNNSLNEIPKFSSQLFILSSQVRNIPLIKWLSWINFSFVFANYVYLSFSQLICKHVILFWYFFKVEIWFLNLCILGVKIMFVFLQYLFELSIFFLSCVEVLLKCTNCSGCLNLILLSDCVLKFNQVSSQIFILCSAVSECVFKLIWFLYLVFEVDVYSFELLI